MTDTRRLVDELWSYCNMMRDDGVGVIEYCFASRRHRGPRIASPLITALSLPLARALHGAEGSVLMAFKVS